MKKISDTMLTLFLCGIICALIIFSPDAREGAANGLEMCESIIIPSLLPVLIISNLIVKSRCSLVFQWLFGRAFEKLLRLPRCCAAAVILGLTGGYPTGAILTSSLHSSGAIDDKTACRIMRFNLCGGVAFIITAVGTVCYGSTKTGIVLFLINTSAALITAFITSLFEKDKPSVCRTAAESLPAAEALPKAADAAVRGIAVMCAYIVLFSALSSIINPPEYLLPMLEITDGICFSDTAIPLPYCAFFLSFGGICIHLQLFGFLKQMHIKYIDFLTCRMLSALISFGITELYVRLFPGQAEVFSNLSQTPAHHFTQGGIALSLVMLVGCAVIIFDIENRKLKLS